MQFSRESKTWKVTEISHGNFPDNVNPFGLVTDGS